MSVTCLLSWVVTANGRIVSFDDTPIDAVSHRLRFSSKASLSNKVEELKAVNDRLEAIQSLKPLYYRGFEPLVPVVDEDDQFRAQYESRRIVEADIVGESSDILEDDMDIDDGDPVVADEAFAALLNDKREIQVGTKVYKYTSHLVFVAEPFRMAVIDKTIATMDQTRPTANLFHRRTEEAANSTTYSGPCTIRMERTLLNDGIELYKSAGCQEDTRHRDLFLTTTIEDRPNCHRSLRVPTLDTSHDGCGGTGGYVPTPSPPSPTPPIPPVQDRHDQSASSYINSLGYCEAKKGLLDFLLGDSRRCISKFGKRHRVKTKFWNQDYLVYTSIGVAVKNQRRKYRIWWTRSTDEIRLGISQAYFEVVHPTPDIGKILQQHAISYEYKGSVYNRWGSQVHSTSGSLPNFPFDIQDNNPVLIYVDLPKILGNDIDQRLTAKQVNELFWGQLWSQAKSIARRAGNTNPKTAVVTGFTNNKVVVNLMDESYQRFNHKKITKIFEEDWGFQIKIGWSASGGWSNPEPDTVKLTDFKNVAVDFYGVARSGSTWRGSKMSYTD